MRSWGFGAREAMGWLRIVLPGSVIGEQQPYLCAVDAALLAARRRSRDLPAAAQLEGTATRLDGGAADLTRSAEIQSIASASAAPGAVAAEVFAEQVSDIPLDAACGALRGGQPGWARMTPGLSASWAAVGLSASGQRLAHMRSKRRRQNFSKFFSII
jgi:hypothetical protein